MNEMPEEMLLIILECVNEDDPLSLALFCSQVCQRWNRLASLIVDVDRVKNFVKQRVEYRARYPPLDSVCSVIAKSGSLSALKWAVSRGFGCGPETCAHAASGGHMESLRWLKDRGCPWDKNTCSALAKGGHLSLLQWARSLGCPWDNDVCDEALRNGHFHVYQWAKDNRCPVYTEASLWEIYGGYF